MKPSAATLLLFALFAVSALVVTAEQPTPPANPTAQSLLGEQAKGTEPPPTPMMKAIRDVFDAEKKAVADLEMRLESAASEKDIITLIRQIEQVKLNAELEVLTIQAKFARRDGRVEQAEQIEASIKKIKDGPPRAAQHPRIDRTPNPQTR